MENEIRIEKEYTEEEMEQEFICAMENQYRRDVLDFEKWEESKKIF
jgi:hypothetical protein